MYHSQPTTPLRGQRSYYSQGLEREEEREYRFMIYRREREREREQRRRQEQEQEQERSQPKYVFRNYPSLRTIIEPLLED